MPISEQAFAALHAAVTWNPDGARGLLASLREYPAWMKYKADPYGPLHIILHLGNHRRRTISGVSMPINPAPFPDDKLPACEVFGLEWRQQRFTKAELADVIEGILNESDS